MLIRYNSWQDFNTLHRQINRLFDSALTPETVRERAFTRVPPAELHETADAIHLKLEVPGMEAKDLDVQVTENAVAISGERKSENKTEENGRTVTEFSYGKFQRVIPLSARIENTNVTAEYKDGILNLTLPKTTQEKNKVVKVNLEQASA
ncbi:Hsp20/alpha crystallin family protein [Aetokthonos hydrillicola Thurmond2011]|jgi:HSP20 family protein|uniref:Hsp20/alpha crystallin family protein n=1 Tax=Aetokthonos hydrillicola Thurmond2011 TaxID=2712845 RepID=A0AAP5M742_9CYAN|nr:Hsp20/alpha crystallin family protein [Aetokthonos hydrillicola]MBO3461562.1 Hsp20/alpha crystallin family protein [Aetokthonos hydrillicola CCALA 1050]MBW4586136.1 Hsp20/alpha crystallin family protein [Aetokthonos hydrillicola CCALA 1050]MDR9897741.1 Hsp20/alpha crystallin family protein [Aetokthonos hydrillicola Thurmond2011]